MATIHILTEGITERIYFDALIAHHGKSDITVRSGKSSDPMRLLNEALQLKESATDVWLVMDAEVPGQDRTRDRRLKKALASGERYGIHFAIATPCFEAWLLSHFDREKNYAFNQSSQFFADMLSKKLGSSYRKTEYNVSAFMDANKLQDVSQSKAGERGLADLLKRLMH